LKISRRQVWAAVLLVVVSFGVRLWASRGAQLPPRRDAGEYDAVAQHLAAGEGFLDEHGRRSSFRPPLYPFFLSLIYRACGHSYPAVALVESLLGAVTVLLLAGIALEAFGSRAALLTGALAAVYPSMTFLYFGPGSLCNETFFIALLSVFLLLMQRFGHSESPRMLIASGALLGLCALTKASSMFLILFVAGFLFWRPRGGEPQKDYRRSAARFLLFFLLPAVLVILPWTIRNGFVHRAFVPISTNGGLSLYWSNNLERRGLQGQPSTLDWSEMAGMSEVEMSAHLTSKAIEELKAQPGRIPKLLVRKEMMLFDPSYTAQWSREDRPIRYNAIYVWAFPLFLYGLLWGLRQGNPRQKHLAGLGLCIIAYFMAITLVFHGDVRYRAQFEAVMVLLAGAGMEQLLAQWGGRAAAGLGVWGLANFLVYLNYGPVLAGIKAIVRAVGLH